VELGETAKFINNGTSAKLEERGFETLIHGASGPLMLQRRRGLETDYYFLFNTDSSTLPYRIAFPILVTNVVQSGLSFASLSDVKAASTGVLPDLNLDADKTYRVVGPEGDSETVRSSSTGRLSGVTAEAVGRYDVFDGNKVVASLGTGLLNEIETGLQPVETFRFTEMELEVGDTEMLESNTSLWWSLAVAAFGFLLLEWWYFQRVKTKISPTV